MVFVKYNFPLPNNGERYDLSQDELVKLLEDAYQKGWDHAREIYDPKMHTTTTASTIGG